MTDDEFRAYQEQAHLLNELSRHPGWAVFVDFLHDKMRSAKERVLAGNADSIENYKHETGKFVGMEFAMKVPTIAAATVITEAERREERAQAERELGE